jgi:hypothetical protein
VVSREIVESDFFVSFRSDSPVSYLKNVGYAEVKYITLLAFLNTVSFLAATLLSGCNSTIPDTIVPGMDIIATTDAEVTVAVSTPIIESGAFKTYQNPQAGYRAEYPADWMVSEQVSEDGTMVTTFSPPDGSAGIMVMVQSGEFGGAGNSDIPNTRCEEVNVGELTGMRCFDTINAARSTTVIANGKTFTIAALGKRLEESIQSRFLSSFQIIK